jgi:putative MATE family efflux protein
MIPSMLSNICYFFFTVIDGIFIGRGVGTDALGAVNIVMPYVMLSAAVFQLVSIGGATICAVDIGRGEKEKAQHIFRSSVVFLFIVAAILCFAGVVFTEPICRAFGADDTYISMSSDYLFWYAAFIIPSGLSLCIQAFCRNDDDPSLVGAAVLISTGMNIFGDWLFVLPLGMGTKGAALATGISETAGLLITLLHFVRKKGILRFGKVKLDPKTFKDIAAHGLPEGVSQLATPVMTLCMNLVLVHRIGDIGVNTFSIISYVSSFTIAVFFGTSEGLQPLFGLTYGMKDEKNLKYIFRAGIIVNFAGSFIVTSLILLFDRQICGLFAADPETLEYTLSALPKFSWGFVIMAFTVMISAYLYSTERLKYALILNVLRSVVVDVLIITILPYIFGAGIIWYTFGIYESIVFVIAVFLLKRSERNGIKFK